MIFFYLPKEDFPPFEQLPDETTIARFPELFLSPALNWVWRTYYHLSLSGFSCQLVDAIPERGIIVCAACNLPLFFKPKPDQFMVSCVADSPPLFFAQCHIFQSQAQSLLWKTSDDFPVIEYMPHWPQPGLLKRRSDRGGVFKNVDYFGSSSQIEPTFKTEETLARFKDEGMALRFHFQNFHDYRDTDCVFGVRSFGEGLITHKPASKLVNAWRAGVPAILGKEGAFREQRESELDYFEVSSVDEMVEACKQLRDNRELRLAMVQQCDRRAKEFSSDTMTERWRLLLGERIPALYEQWQSLSWLKREQYYSRRFLDRAQRSLTKRFQRFSDNLLSR